MDQAYCLAGSSFSGINLLVTWLFDARVDKQGDAYATGVLALILSACIASVIQAYQHRTGSWYHRVPWYFSIITIVFAYTLFAILIEKPVGLKIALCFIAAILVLSFSSRMWRTTELRFDGFDFEDEYTRNFLYPTFCQADFKFLFHTDRAEEVLASRKTAFEKNIELMIKHKLLS